MTPLGLSDTNQIRERVRAARLAHFALCKFIGSCLLLTLLGPAAGQDSASRTAASRGVITLKVDGPLSPEVREALADLIEPDSVSRLIDVVSKFGAPIQELCAHSFCPSLDQAIASTQAGSQHGAHVAGLVAPTMDTFRNFDLYRERYALIGRDNSIINAAGVWTAGAAIAVPTEKLKANNLPIGDEALVIPPRASKAAVSIIEKDLQVGGSSERQFRLNRLLSNAELAARLEVVQRSPALTLDTQPPREAFSFIQFQTSGADCSANPANWPFDPAQVVKVMKFNEKIRERLKLGPQRRSRILIVDTGLGKTLAQSELFNAMLFADPAEIITPASVQKQQSGDPLCTDGNDNGYWRDVYGAGSGPDVSDENRCLLPSFDHLDLLQPHPRKMTSQQFYHPDHGSFVGALAAGGPKFIASFPTVSNYVGLSFFRVTRRSDDAALHVANEFSDITRSLEYAAKIEADVINMSLKTERDTAFRIFEQNRISLLIASAGNLKEDLDQRAPENRPASMEDFRDRMIVVAALQPNEVDPFWPESARSSSKVHIAAPGALITSFGAEGQNICDSGTSAAAPLVSFSAAILRALTGAPREIVRARLLAASDHLSKLADLVEDGRQLNVEAALDIFVDRVELNSGLKRGWIEPASAGPLVRVCRSPGDGLSDLRGRIDLALLWEWWKPSEGKAAIRHQIEGRKFTLEPCDVPQGKFSFFDLATGNTTEIQWSDVKKLLPTPFRALKGTILKSNSLGEALGIQ